MRGGRGVGVWVRGGGGRGDGGKRADLFARGSRPNHSAMGSVRLTTRGTAKAPKLRVPR